MMRNRRTVMSWNPTPMDVSTQTYNGLCYCRGALDLHPFHRLAYEEWADDLTVEYVGKHRAPEALT